MFHYSLDTETFASSNSFVQVWGTALGHLKSVRQLVVLELSKIVNEDCNTLCPSRVWKASI